MLVPNMASADEPVMKPMRQGDVAPWIGVLLNPAAVAQIKVNLDTAKAACDITTKKAVDTVTAQCVADIGLEKAAHEKDKAVDAAIIKANSQALADALKRLDTAEKAKSNPYIWLGLGGAAGIAVTILTVVVVSSVK